MGESYRGLTIRIGADTTSLQKSLKAINAAASSTQKELSKLTKALKLDPSNLGTAATKLRLLGDSAQDAKAKLNQLQSAEDRINGTEIERLADATRNVSARTETLRAAYNDVNAALERVNRQVSSFAELNGLTEEQAREVLGLKDKYAQLCAYHERYQAQLEKMKKAEAFQNLRVEIQSTSAALKGAITQMTRMATEVGEAGSNVAGINKARQELERLDSAAQEVRAEFSVLSDSLKLDPSDIESVRNALANLTEQEQLAQKRAALLNDEIKRLNDSGVDTAGKSMDELRADTQRAAAQFEKLQEKIAGCSSKVEALKAAQAKALDGSDAVTARAEYERLQKEIDQTEQELYQLETQARQATKALDTASAREQLRKLQSEAEQTRTELKQLSAQKVDVQVAGGVSGGVSGSTLRSVGSALTNVGVYSQMAGSYVIDSAETIDAAFRDMKKTVQGTDEDFEQLREAAIEFSKTHVTSADTILEIEAMGGQLGISVDKLEEFADVASNLDIATDIDADDIAQKLGQFNNILDWGEGDMERFGDALVRLGNNMPAQESAIVDITDRIGAAGTMYGMTTPQILAWSTAIAATGQNSEAAGTAVSNSLSFIENAVASGGDKLEQLANVAGMTTEEFSNLWNTSASDAFEAFVQGLARLEEQGESSDVALTEMGITAVRQKQALKGLSQTTDVLSDALQMSQDAWDGAGDKWGEAGDAAREAAQKSEGFSGAMGMLRNTAAALGDTVGESLLPWIEKLTEILADADEWFSGLSEGKKQFILLAAAITPVAGIALNFAGAIKQVFDGFTSGAKEGGKLKTAINQIKTAFASGTTAGGKFNGVLGSLKTLASGALPGLLTTLAVAGVAFLATKLADAKERADDFAAATEGIKSAAGLAEGNVRSFSQIVEDYGGSAANVKEEVDDLIESTADLADTLNGRNSDWQKSSSALQEYGTVVANLAGQSDLTNEEVGLLSWAIDGLNDVCGTNYEVIQDQAGAYQVMADGVTVAKDAISELITQMQLQTRMETIQDNYSDVIAQQEEAAKTVADAQKAYDEAVQKYEDAKSNGRSYMDHGVEINREAESAQTGMLNAKKTLEESQATLDALGESATSYVEQMGFITSAMGDTSGDLLAFVAGSSSIMAALGNSTEDAIKFADALEQANVSAEQLGTLTPTQMMQMASSFDGSVGSILQSLLTMQDGFAESVEQAGVSMEELAACFSADDAAGIQANLTAFADTLRNSGLDSAADFIQNFASTLSAGAGETAAAADTVATANETVMDASTEEIAQDGTEAGDEYAQALEGESGDAAAAAESVSSSAESALSSTDTYTIGLNFTQGYANGILAGQNAAINAAASVAAAAQASVQKTNDTHSPSRKARKLGAYFGEGYALGIQDLASDATRAARLMAADTMAAVRSSYAGYDFAGAAAAAAYGYNKAQASYSGGYSGLSKADAYDAFDSAIKSNAGTELAVYVDGKKLASTIAGSMDSELGTLATRRGR